MIQVTVHGAEGRMGRLVTGLIQEAEECQLAALITEPGREKPTGTFHPLLPLNGQAELAAVHPPGGVIVDFSAADALPGLLAGGAATAAPLVIGTTGLDTDQVAALAGYAREHPVVWATNFSLGIPALQLALELLARTLPADFEAELVETHHHHKRDRPSGTAKVLAETWQAARGTGPVPIHSLRLGGVVGEHAWRLSDQEETLHLVHQAHSRRAFLRGVLPAVRFVAGAKAGLYDLKEVLAAKSAGQG